MTCTVHLQSTSTEYYHMTGGSDSTQRTQMSAKYAVHDEAAFTPK